MKNRKILSLTLIYLFVFTMLPINFFTTNVQAIDGYVRYDSKSTTMGNKYDIKGKILNVKHYKDCIVVLTYDTLCFIEDGKIKKYELGKEQVLSNTNINRVGDYIYLAPYKKGTSYEILSVDKKKMVATSESISDYIKLKNYNLQEVKVDCNGNKWFSVYDKDNKEYILFELENGSNSSVKKIETIKEEKDINYKKCITDLKIDSNETVWFKIIEESKNKDTYKLKRVSNKSRSYVLTFDEEVKNYIVAEDDSVWAISGDVLIHKLKGGTTIDKLKGTNIKDVKLDRYNNLWILDDNKVKKEANGKLKDIYNVEKDSNSISIYDDKNLSVLNNRGLTIINDGEMEEGSSDSYIRNSALVLKDNNSDIRVLSDNYENNEDSKQSDDMVLEVSLNNSKFSVKNKFATNFANYSSAKIFNDNVYFPQYNTLYKVKGNLLQEYVVFNKDRNSNEFASGLEFDKDGNAYVLGNKNVYFIDRSKNVSKIDLSKICQYDSQCQNILLKDNKNNIYLISKSNKGAKLNKLEGSEFRTINYRSPEGLEPINIFLNENDEFEFVYKGSKNIYSIYKLDENSLPQEDIRFSNEGSALVKTYNEIRGLKKTNDGKLLLWIGKNMVYMKDASDNKFRLLYDIEPNDNVNSMVKGNDGKVYIGTYLSGILSYGEKINLNPSDYDNKVPKKGKDCFNNKEWIIKFNKELDKSTVNNSNIIVVNKLGEKHSVKVTLTNNNYAILVSPVGEYRQGDEYYIIIKDSVKSKSGRKLKKSILAKFNIIKTEAIDNEVEFKIIEPQNMDIRNKSFMEFVINEWKHNFQDESKSKGYLSKVGKVNVNDVKVAADTGYISFNAEFVTQKDGKIVKEKKDFNLNCKKINDIWKIL